MKQPIDLRIKIFADGANLADFRRMLEEPYVRGFTTNPTLMRGAGVTDYLSFAHEVQPAMMTVRVARRQIVEPEPVERPPAPN